MRLFNYLLALFILCSNYGCSESGSESSVTSYNHNARASSKVVADIRFPEPITGVNQGERGEYIAYEHFLTTELPAEEVEPVFHKLQLLCQQEMEKKCTILHSSLSNDEKPYGRIHLRIHPTGVDKIIDLASEQGGVIQRETKAEDLQDVIIDNQKRLEMLLQYQSRLIELEQKSASDIDTLIKVAEKLASVQSDIEYSQGKKAKLLKRTQMDVVQVELHSKSYTSFWNPISDSLSHFGENLSDGLSEAITAIAYLFPWTLIVLFLFYLIRIIWRKTRS
ncbi:hypothetical protein BTJ40_12470 [Microbulbifer sp. A4B17]|uniref:DUF4349 domain-containing protein n=1 Tax=Microbulbifer sp. A4B17 TaxID=359370 RepID=UPI000D52F146|nr:DUF4349 domain-containing protein [Microbulbifer sp. A4B17]AWF81572.1 hypothetical protein BTJ40_12470 [Microbulbifer sp. A4B17]